VRGYRGPARRGVEVSVHGALVEHGADEDDQHEREVPAGRPARRSPSGFDGRDLERLVEPVALVTAGAALYVHSDAARNARRMAAT
jgi:hypothetical protein